jgi:hypothetical protein
VSNIELTTDVIPRYKRYLEREKSYEELVRASLLAAMLLAGASAFGAPISFGIQIGPPPRPRRIRQLDALAQAAILEAIRLDDQEASALEAKRRQVLDSAERASQEKARLENKPNFRP